MFLCRAISLVLQTREISLHKHNSCVLPRLIKHSIVLVIVPCSDSTLAEVVMSHSVVLKTSEHVKVLPISFLLFLTSPFYVSQTTDSGLALMESMIRQM